MNKFGTKLNTKNQQLLKVVGSFIVFVIIAALCLLALFSWVFNKDAFGWFVFNKDPAANQIGMDITSQHALNIAASADGAPWLTFENQILTVDFDDIFCGTANSRTLVLRHTNTENKDLYISWHFGAPNGSSGAKEVAYQNGGSFYYLGSQMTVSDITIAVDGIPHTAAQATIPGKGQFLVATAPQGGGQVLYTGSEITTIPKLELIKGLAVPAQRTTTITLTFTFADNGLDQSIYQNFSGECSRLLYYKISESAEQ